jgi:transposase
VRELLEQMPSLNIAIGPLLRVLEQLVTEREAMDRLLGQAARKDPVCLRLMTIPGAGPITSLAFRTTVDDPVRFASSKSLGAHIGLTPRVYQSRETDRSRQISKAGDHMLRHLLYEAASALMARCRQPSKLRAWGVALARRSGAREEIGLQIPIEKSTAMKTRVRAIVPQPCFNGGKSRMAEL